MDGAVVLVLLSGGGLALLFGHRPWGASWRGGAG